MGERKMIETLDAVNMVYRAGIYCRLSQDDGNVGDSSSIQTQKAILEKYCQEKGFIISDIYIDDGYSGTNFNRPDFQRMIQDIEDKKINLVITKDQSRLGRDYIMAGHYMEIYFPIHNVRYIALNDGVDTINGNNDILPFKNILNDMYSKDLSRKVRASLRQKSLQGMYLGADAPYGYKRDPNNKNKLLIDNETAVIVRKIFNLILSGYGTVNIARVLTKELILTPSATKLKSGNARFERFVEKGDECLWTDGMIKRIIKDQMYAGDMVNCKTQIANYKTRKIVTNSKDKQIIVPNTHEAIITRDEFERAQRIYKERRLPRKRYHVDNIFRGIVKCSICGKSLVLTTQKRRGKLECYYRCNTFTSYKAKEKHWITINYKELKEIVTERLKKFFVLFKDDKELLAIIQKKINDNKNSINYEKELYKIEVRQNTLTNITKKVYDDYFEGLINHDTYQSLIKKYQDEQNELKVKHDNLMIEKNKQNNYLKDINKLKELVHSFLDFKELTQEMVYSLIDKIEIDNVGAYKQHKERTIKITYRFLELEL